MATYVRSDGVYFPDGTLQSTSTNLSIRSVQTGYVTNINSYGGGVEDEYYKDVTISSVLAEKTFVLVQPCGVPFYYSGSQFVSYPTARLYNATTIRLSVNSYGYNSTCRFYVIEYN